MKPIERVVAALKREPADRIPVYPILSGVTRSLVGADYYTWATDADVCAKALIKATDDFELDCICTLIDLSVEAADFGQAIDYPENEAAHPDMYNRMLQSTDDYPKITKVNPRETPRMKMHIDLCRKLMEARGAEVPVVAFVFGPLGILSMLRGQSDLYMDIYDEPETVHDAVNLITEVLIEYCDALMETGVHAIMFDTLFASGSIMGKEMWREFEGEAMRRLAGHVHAKGCMVMIHNCGHKVYFDAQIETMKPEAISFLHIPDDCQSFVECKEKYGEVTTLIGCIPPTALPLMSEEDVRASCREQIDQFAEGGGFVLATGCEYPANLSLDHARTIVDMAKTYGRCRELQEV